MLPAILLPQFFTALPQAGPQAARFGRFNACMSSALDDTGPMNPGLLKESRMQTTRTRLVAIDIAAQVLLSLGIGMAMSIALVAMTLLLASPT